MTLLQKRLLAAGLSTLIALALAAWLWSSRTKGNTVTLVDNWEGVERLLEERGRTATVESPPSDLWSPLEIPAEDAGQLFPSLLVKSGRHLYDPQCFYWAKPDMRASIRFEEHPLGGWTRQTNNMGFRSTSPTELETTAPRILVTGDSHIEGLAAGEELCTSQLARLLDLDSSWQGVEVLNAGRGGYTFYNYVGILEKFSELKPDAFVVIVYGGNDYKETLKVRRYELSLPIGPRRPKGWARKIQRAARDFNAIMSQFLSQALIFVNSEEELQLAEECSWELTEYMQRRCKELGIPFVLVYLPPLHDVQRPLIQSRVDDLLEIFDLEPSALNLSDELTTRYLARARDAGIHCLDLREAFQSQQDELFWQQDHHLNVRGHELLAEQLAPLVRDVVKLPAR